MEISTLANTPTIPAIQRQEGETDLAYHYFISYIELGPGRSYSKVRIKYDKTPSYDRQIQRWASKFTWVSRARKYDEHIIRKALFGKEVLLKRATGRLLLLLERAIDNIEDVLDGPEILPSSELRTTYNQKLKAAEMVLNRFGLTQKTEQIDVDRFLRKSFMDEINEKMGVAVKAPAEKELLI